MVCGEKWRKARGVENVQCAWITCDRLGLEEFPSGVFELCCVGGREITNPTRDTRERD